MTKQMYVTISLLGNSKLQDIPMMKALFVQFISLIYMNALRKEMRKSVLIERYTVRELLEEMETLVKVKYSGKYGYILTEVAKPQREILEYLEIVLSKTT